MNLRRSYNRLFRSADFSNVLVPHIDNPLFGNQSQWLGNGLIFGVCDSFPNPARGPRRRQAVGEHVRDRIHKYARVSLGADVCGQFVHSNGLVAVALKQDTSLALRSSLLLGLRTLLLRITENKGQYQPIEKHFPASLQNGVHRTTDTACMLQPQ